MKAYIKKFQNSGKIDQEGVRRTKIIQSKIGVKVDGVWGPKTERAYQEYLKSFNIENTDKNRIIVRDKILGITQKPKTEEKEVISTYIPKNETKLNISGSLTNSQQKEIPKTIIKENKLPEINIIEKEILKYVPDFSLGGDAILKAKELDKKYKTEEFTNKYYTELRKQEELDNNNSNSNNSSSNYFDEEPTPSNIKNSAVIDKKTGKIKVYDKTGNLIKEDLVNYGKKDGDSLSAEHYSGYQNKGFQPRYVNTPKGEFKIDSSSYGGYTNKDYPQLDQWGKQIKQLKLKDKDNKDLYFSLHTFPKGVDKEDFKKSHGCIRMSDGTLSCLKDNKIENLIIQKQGGKVLYYSGGKLSSLYKFKLINNE